MEKQLPDARHHNEDTSRPRRPRRSLAANVLLMIVLTPFIFYITGTIISVTKLYGEADSEDATPIEFSHDASDNNSSSPFDWDTITPTKDLVYRPCYGGHYRCARLLLPMDWHANASAASLWNHTVALAVIKLHAPNVSSVLGARYGGEVYINPGGPGASGVNAVQRFGALIQSVVSSPEEDGEGKVYDVVSFDPRGVRFSTPRVSCFRSVADEKAWYELHATYGGVDSSDRAMATLWARAHALGAACDPVELSGDEPEQNEGDLLKYHVSTTVVARDLVEIIERSGELREKLAREALKSAQLTAAEKEAKFDALRWRQGEEKLQYWGFSYGSALGGYFATMYPSRVGRMVLDGGGDYNDWISGEWKTFLDRAESSLRWLYRDCHAAGQGHCALYSPHGPYVIEDMVTEFLEEVRDMPIIVPDADGKDGRLPDVLTYEDLINALFAALYKPYTSFVELTSALSSLMVDRSNATAARAILSSPRISSCSGIDNSDSCTSDKCLLDSYAVSPDAEMAIACSDGPDLRGETLPAFSDWFQFQRRKTPLFAGLQAPGMRLACTAWPARPAWRFEGSFGGVQTAHPLLFVANAADPISSPGGVAAMAGAFEGAGLVRIEGLGHCSVSVPSSCAFEKVRAYFQGEEGPDEETVCGVDWQPFLAGDRKVQSMTGTGGDARLRELAAEMVEAEAVARWI